MSRRRSRVQPLPWDDTPQAHWSEVSWWYDQIPGFEPWTWSQWQDAWVEVTLSVIQTVWHRQGAALYNVHRDAGLKEDLQDWLLVAAQNVASKYMPSPWHPAPSRAWGSYLDKSLSGQARWHFRQVVGRREEDQKAYNFGIDSTERLADLEAEGRTVARHALHGNSFGTEDPLAVIIRCESFAVAAAEAERADRESGTHSTSSSTAGGVCLINLCTRPVKARGLCHTHYKRENDMWTSTLCEIPECGEPHKGLGLCRRHWAQLRRGALPEEYQQYVREAHVRGTCSEEGCEEPHSAKGYCQPHYDAHRRAKPAPPCNVEGCAKQSATRGMCPMHYQRWRKNRAAQKGVGGHE